MFLKEIKKHNINAFDMRFQNSINMVNLFEKKNSNIETSLLEVESVQFNNSKQSKSVEDKNEEELNKMFTKLEISQSVILTQQKTNIESFVKEEEEKYIPTIETNIFKKMFKKPTKNFCSINHLPDLVKINKNEILKLKDDEIIEKITKNKIFYILNLWQNLALKDR